ncbi:MAG: hypothetical protein ACTHM9_09850 [Gemmatimonadales bacterium]
MRSRSAARGLATLALAFAASWVGCGGGSDISGPATGSLDVTIATTGPEPDADGYTLSIDGAAPEAIAANATRHAEGLGVGSHRVDLGGLAANCATTSAGGTSATVSIDAGGTANVRFDVACAPTTGTIEVATTSAGSPPDPDGYEVQLDGVDAQPIGVGATLTLPGVAAGDHTVGLTGLAANCSVEGNNPLAVSVAAGTSSHVALSVTCGAPTPPPAPGGISVTTVTSGPDQGADGYSVSLDGGAAIAIGLSATLSLPNVAAGAHTVGLTGLAENCRADGDNPRSVMVAAGTVAPVAFTIVCTALPPSTGTLEIATATSGPNQDTDGYAFTIDGGTAQPIGVTATVSVAGLVPGSHSIVLQGTAPNCTINGQNPLAASIGAGATARVTFAVTCVAATGALTVTTTTSGSPLDPDGYTLSIDNGTASALGVSASATIQGLAPGPHSVLLGGLAANCKVEGDNPRTVTVPPAGTVTSGYTVICTPTTGSLAVTIGGLPAGTNAGVTVTGPNNLSTPVAASTTLTDLVPGTYTVVAAPVPSGGTTYNGTPASSTQAVAAGATATATVTYGPAAGPSLNLRIDSWQLTQSVQSAAGDVPLVANRGGLLRVFVVADHANTAKPSVRVQVYRNGAVVRTLLIPAPRASVPLTKDETTLASSWNVELSRDLFAPGLAVLADVDPDNAVAEKNENDNAYPASGIPAVEPVSNAPTLAVRFVPVRQQVSGLTGDVSTANTAQFLDLPRRMYPVSTTDGDVHAVYTTTTADALQPDDANRAWETILAEVNALQVAEGSTRNYYGVVRLGYASGVAGLGYIGAPTAIGYDDPTDRSRVMAHEIGHNFGRLHSPCGQPSGPDPAYPYPGGLTGVYGYDLQANVLKSPLAPDIMGYCPDPWVSDYTYSAILAFRSGSSAGLRQSIASAPERCLLVWGRIVDGRPVLEPGFEIVTRPSLPTRPGPYTVEGVRGDGSRVFSLSFDASDVEDGRGGSRQFAFAVPLRSASGSELTTLALAGPAGRAAASRATTMPGANLVAPVLETHRVAGGVSLRWDPSAHPMVMVRDPETGEVVSFARGGAAAIATNLAALDMVVSDGVGSQTLRVVPGP